MILIVTPYDIADAVVRAVTWFVDSLVGVTTPVTTGTTLTLSAVSSDVVDVTASQKFSLLVDYTKGTEDGLSIGYLFSDEGTIFYAKVLSTVSSGVLSNASLADTFTASGRYTIPIEAEAGYAKISWKAISSLGASPGQVTLALTPRH